MFDSLSKSNASPAVGGVDVHVEVVVFDPVIVVVAAVVEIVVVVVIVAVGVVGVVVIVIVTVVVVVFGIFVRVDVVVVKVVVKVVVVFCASLEVAARKINKGSKLSHMYLYSDRKRLFHLFTHAKTQNWQQHQHTKPQNKICNDQIALQGRVCTVYWNTPSLTVASYLAQSGVPLGRLVAELVVGLDQDPRLVAVRKPGPEARLPASLLPEPHEVPFFHLGTVRPGFGAFLRLVITVSCNAQPSLLPVLASICIDKKI